MQGAEVEQCLLSIIIDRTAVAAQARPIVD